MVMAAAAYLIREGPITPKERWEEASGYSPSTLEVCIAEVTGAAVYAGRRGGDRGADFIQACADFLERHVESWTVTTAGRLVPGIPRHFIRVHPVAMGEVQPDEDPNRGTLRLTNQPPGAQAEFPANEIVDAGFLELVRYGIRDPHDPLVVDSLRVIDAVLKVGTPVGPCWHRYNHDGYGQRPDGGPFKGWGQGRAWPTLTGGRGLQELCVGGSVEPYRLGHDGL